MKINPDSVTKYHVDASHTAQRIDNFLFWLLKGVPKSHVYRILRSGEVRVNGKRINQTYKLQADDEIRIPPIRVAAESAKNLNIPPMDFPIIYEDDALLAINKPAGVAVHGGSGISFGVIEQLRQAHPEWTYLELVHRLDRETSGLLLIAKKRSALVKLHEMLRGEAEHKVLDKRYMALVYGKWVNNRQHVRLPLLKTTLSNGERFVKAHPDGIAAHTIFNLKQRWPHYALLEAELKTGRTHQIRVHLAASGFPIVGDEKYGDFNLNKQLQKQGLKRMFLHAFQLTLPHPLTGEILHLEAPLPDTLQNFINGLHTLYAKP